MTKRKVIGIDFGSTQSSITYMTIGSSFSDKPEFIKIDGYENIPTVMAVDKSDRSIRAWGGAVTSFIRDNNQDDYFCVGDFKRELGSSKEADFYCREFIKRLASEVKKEFTGGGELDYEFYDTIVSVPVSWSAEQISLLKKFMVEAGLPCEPKRAPESLHNLLEPFAAMYAVRHQENSFEYGSKAEYYAVVDFGGGTLDICIVRTEATGKDPQCVASAGNPQLGGKDFDDLLLKHICKHTALTLEQLTEPQKAELRYQIKNVKERVSRNFKKVSGDYERIETLNLFGKNYEFTISRDTIRNLYKGMMDELQKVFTAIP